MNKTKDFTKKLPFLLICIVLTLAAFGHAESRSRIIAQNTSAPSPYEKQNAAEVESYLAKAKNYFEMAEFTFAQIFYDKALRLDKNNKAIQAKIEQCKEYRERQKALLSKAPKGDKRKEYLESKYDAAKDLYKDDEYQNALKEFEEIWLISMKGDYKNARKYMKKIKEKIEEEKKEKAEAQREAREKAREKALEEARERSEELVEEGEDLLDDEKYDEAIDRFTKALALDKTNDDAAELLEEAQEEKKEAVKEAREKAEMAKKEAAEAKKEAKEAEENKEKIEEAKKRAEKEAERKKKELEAIRKQQEEREKEMAEKEAEEKRKKEMERKREEERERRKRLREEKEKEEQEAKERAEKIKEMQEEKAEQAEENTEKAKKLLSKEKYDDAILAANEALKIDPLYAEAIKVKAQAETAKQRAEERKAREREEKRKAEARRKEIERLENQGEDYFDAGNYDAAAEKFQEMLKIEPGNEDARDMLDEIAEAKKEEKIEKAESLADQGEELLSQDKFAEARSKFQAALAIDMNNDTAREGLKNVAEAEREARERLEEEQARRKREQSMRVFREGVKAYEDNDIETATAKWKRAVEIDPDNEKAQTYLEETADELAAYQERMAEKQAFQDREDAARKKMNTLISVSTTVPHTPLISYLDSLSLVSGINFYVTSGVEATVDAKFVDTPLKEVLNTLLPPIGLKWNRKPGSDIVTIQPDLQAKFFNLTPEEASKVQAVMDNGDLQRILWGPDGTPKMKGVELTLDEREGVLISVDSKENIQKLQAFLDDMKKAAPPGLIFRTYRLREGEGPKVKSLIEAILRADSRAPYDPERKLLLDGRDLIVKDTAENIQKIEQLLQDKNFIGKIRDQKLEVHNFILVPKEALQQNPEQLRQFGEWVVEVIKVMLYAETTVSKAEAEGRRLWWDPATMQLTLTDYPDNLQAVSDFIYSLPQLEQESKSKIIPLRYSKAEVIATRINSFLGLAEDAAGVTGAGGLSVTKSLSVGDEFEFRDLSLMLMTVNENDVNDDNDDSIELKVRTPGESRDVNLDEFDSDEVEDYEIIADDVDPSSTPGEGRARIKITYISPEEQEEYLEELEEEEEEEEEDEETEEGEKAVQAIEEINAIFVEYTDPTHLDKVERWIERLDVRVQQVSIETKFVEVIESRAKEFSSQLAIADLTQGIDFSDSVLNMRFANDIDELQNALNSQYEPVAESPYYQHFMKSTTVFSLITGGNSPINWQLRLLEAEGVVNVVNGPHITVQNGESASFTITRVLGGIPEVDSSGNYVGDAGIQAFDPVDLSINEVFVTQLGDITLDLSATIEDMDAQTGGGVVTQTDQQNQDVQTGSVQYSLSRLTKDFDTKAHIKDGGTIVLGGWTSERSGDYNSGIPIIHNIPFVGKMLFGRNLRHIDRTTLLIFLTGRIVD